MEYRMNEGDGMFGLTPGQADERNRLAEELKAKGNALTDAICKFNEFHDEYWQYVEQDQIAYVETVTKMRDFIKGVVAQVIQNFYQQPEEWRDSKEGEQVLRFVDKWEDMESELIIPDIKSPEILEEFDTDYNEYLVGKLPQEPDIEKRASGTLDAIQEDA